MPLTDTGIKNTKPTGKALKFFDGGGLFLHVPLMGVSGGSSSTVLRVRKN